MVLAECSEEPFEMASGAVSEVGAGNQGGTAPVAILHGTQPAQGKFGSLQDFWAILGSHGISAPTTAGELSSFGKTQSLIADGGSTAKVPVKTQTNIVANSGLTPPAGAVPTPVVPSSVSQLVKPVVVAAQHEALLGSAVKETTSGDGKKHSKASDGDKVTAKTPETGATPANAVPVTGAVAPVGVQGAGAAKVAADAASSVGRRAPGPSRIPDGLVSKLGVADSASDKAAAVGSDTGSSGAGHSGGNAGGSAATVQGAGVGLASPVGADASTVFATTLVPALESTVAAHGVSVSAAAHTGLAQSAGANGDADGSAGYGGVSGVSEPRMVMANSSVLEIGLTGGAHDGLRVRAELGHTGEVTASLVASNAGSAQSLDKHLGAMADYLKTEAVSVGSLTVSASAKSAGTDVSGGMSGGGTGAGAGGSAGSGENARQGQNFPGWPGASNASSPEEVLSGLAQTMMSGVGSVPSAVLGSGVGGWLNVRV